MRSAKNQNKKKIDAETVYYVYYKSTFYDRHKIV